MATVMDVYHFLDGKAPFSTQMSFDNAGFLVGRGDKEVHTILVALDITETVVEEAVQAGAELIVSHHPVIFFPAKHITDQDPSGRKLLALLEHNIAAICAHTNLDIAPGAASMTLLPRPLVWSRSAPSARMAWGGPELSPVRPARRSSQLR